MNIYLLVLAAALLSVSPAHCATPALESLNALVGTENMDNPGQYPPYPQGPAWSPYYPGPGWPPYYPPHPQPWGNTSCFYDGENFRVIYRVAPFELSVDAYVLGTICSGGWDVAGIYDEDNFFVFSGVTRKFASFPADDGYMDAKIAAGDGFVALYDGDDLIVYNARAGKFYSRAADDAPATAVLVRGKDLAALYDGDDLLVYDQDSSQFYSGPVDDNYAGFTLGAGRQTVLAYDGDDVFAYCSPTHSFSKEAAADGERAQVYQENGSPAAEPVLYVGKAFYAVEPSTCKIKKDDLSY